ncbi:MAG: FAD-dependent oxidoreductase [Sphingomonadaceae bacterium]|nr:FAD-dependent oxidoreductase [Sphingomonadaceae bacterium]
MPPRILIVGAGPTGLTAAVELARRGIVATVIEKRDAPSRLSRAVGILPASMRILEPSGVAEAIAAEAVAFRNAVIHRGAEPIARLRLDQSPDPHHRLLGLPQDRTETLLREAFEKMGGTVRFGCPLDRVEQGSEEVRAEIGGEIERFDHVIGADGTNSRLRDSLGLAYSGFDLPGDWSIADVIAPDWPHQQDFCIFLKKAGKVAIVAPLAPHRFRIIANDPDALEALPMPIDETEIRRQAPFRISVRQAERYSAGRAFLAGDAAHCHSPVGGRGMNLGIADAADLARRFTENGLDGYHRARHKAGSETIRFTERGRRNVMSKSRIRRAALIGLIKTVCAIPALNRLAVRALLSG